MRWVMYNNTMDNRVGWYFMVMTSSRHVWGIYQRYAQMVSFRFCRIVPIVTIAGYLLSSHLSNLMSVVSSITTSNNSGCTDTGATSAPLLSSCSKLLFYFTFRHKRSFSSSSSSSKSLLYVTFQHKRYFKWHCNTIKTLQSIDEMI